MSDVAVILINYNSSHHTISCVESIFSKTNTKLHFEIIITDNCSETEDFNTLKKFVNKQSNPKLKLYRSPTNIGFGGGNMHGYQYTNAPYVAFVNNDTLFLNDCLSILKKYLETDDAIGVVGGQAFKENGDFMISLDHFASPMREILGRSFLEFINPKKYPKRKKAYLKPITVNFVPGSFMMLRRKDFESVGGFDRQIFLYYEETDLCLRLKKINKSAVLVPEAKFTHLHGASTGKSIPIKKELKISLLYIMKKHYGNWGYFSVFAFLLIKYGMSSIIKSKNRPLFSLILKGAPMSESLQYKQSLKEV
ncbi:glycosyltransferase family 2 protein [Paucihalobacter sp.]|uniref:glycosyltransferase family 2 protein n=1 Tax=Paucihalobacter sp. TaxID=2850405 RepID=UPI003D161EB3